MAGTSIDERLVDCWNRRDYDGFGKLLHRDYSYTGPDGKTVQGGPKVGVEVAKTWAAAISDGVLTITNRFSSGNKLVCEFVCHGTHQGELMGVAPTHNPLEIRVCLVADIEDEKIIREREYIDTLSILEQIGAGPEMAPRPPSHEPAQPAPRH